MKISLKVILPILLGTTIVSGAASIAYYSVMAHRIADERASAAYSSANSLKNLLQFDYRVASVVESIRNTYKRLNLDVYPTDEEGIANYSREFHDDLKELDSDMRGYELSYNSLANNVLQIASVSEDFGSVVVAFVDKDRNRLVCVAGSDSAEGSAAVAYNIGSWRDLPADSALIEASQYLGNDPLAEINYVLDKGISSKPLYLTAIPFYRTNVAPQYRETMAYCIVSQPQQPKNSDLLIGTSAMVGGFFASGLLMAVLVFLFLRHYLTRPIQRISQETARVSSALSGRDISALNYTSALHKPSKDEIEVLDTSIGQMVVSARNALEKIKRDSNELEIASKIQLSSLPKPYERTAIYEVSGFMRPAKEVGGDFYDYFSLGGGRYAILIADVSGKGVPAAMFMMRGKALAKDRARWSPSLKSLFFDINNELISGNDENLFLTCFMAVIDPLSKRMEYISAGHDPMILLRNGKVSELPCNTNLVLAAVPDFEFQSQIIELEDHDQLFAYTDGLSEAMNEQGQLFGKERILECLSRIKPTNPAETIRLAEADVRSYVGAADQSDDMTMVCLQFHFDNQIVLRNAETALEEALAFASSKAAAAGCSKADIGRIETCIDEIVTNVVNYAFANAQPTIIITAFCPEGKDYIEYSIRDHGPAFNPLESEDPDTTLEAYDRPIGGLGIYLVKNLMDDVEYCRVDRENVLTIRKKIS